MLNAAWASASRFRHIKKLARTRGGAVGRVLFCAAKLAIMMMSFEDDELIRGNLLGNPPLHPRRSLHQAFCGYGDFIPNVEELDKEQVVYKATTPVTLDIDGGPWTSALPRILMVDQLWLFVLDKSMPPNDVRQVGLTGCRHRHHRFPAAVGVLV